MSTSKKQGRKRRGFMNSTVAGAAAGTVSANQAYETGVNPAVASSTGEDQLWNGEPGDLHKCPPNGNA